MTSRTHTHSSDTVFASGAASERKEAHAESTGQAFPYAIMTKDGWRPLMAAMQPVAPHAKWWSFAGAASYDKLFHREATT